MPSDAYIDGNRIIESGVGVKLNLEEFNKEQHQQIILGKQQQEKVFEGPYFPIPFQKISKF